MSVKPSTCYSWVTCQYLYTMHNDNSFIWQRIWTLLGGVHWVGIHEVRIHRVGIWKGGNSPGGNSPGGNGPGRNSPGEGFTWGNFPYTDIYFLKFISHHIKETLYVNILIWIKTPKKTNHELKTNISTCFWYWCWEILFFLNVKTTISRFYAESA